MAEPTEVERLREMYADSFVTRLGIDALIAAVRAEALAVPSEDDIEAITTYVREQWVAPPDAEEVLAHVVALRQLRGAK